MPEVKVDLKVSNSTQLADKNKLINTEPVEATWSHGPDLLLPHEWQKNHQCT